MLFMAVDSSLYQINRQFMVFNVWIEVFYLFHHHVITDFSLIALQLEACAHPFFDELREPNARLPNGRPFPPLFNFKQEVCNWPFLFS